MLFFLINWLLWLNARGSVISLLAAVCCNVSAKIKKDRKPVKIYRQIKKNTLERRLEIYLIRGNSINYIEVGYIRLPDNYFSQSIAGAD